MKERKLRPYVPKIGGEKEVVYVPAADEMTDENFIKHMQLRHAKDCTISNETETLKRTISKWAPMYRKFHERLHNIAVPGQYDHEHEED